MAQHCILVSGEDIASGAGLGTSGVRLDTSGVRQGRHSSALQLSDALATTAALALCGGLYVSLHQWPPAQRFSTVLATAALIALLATALSPRVQARAAG